LVDLFEYMMMHGLTNPKSIDLFANASVNLDFDYSRLAL